ncbi:MAG: hypothetical protein WBL50_10750 [Candidatus Acidiferrum sp.]
MKAANFDSLDEREKLDQYTLSLLFRAVFPQMSDMFVFTIAYFSEGDYNKVDEQFRRALKQELFRRRLLEAPHSSLDDVNVDKLLEDDLCSFESWFACDAEERTLEDRYLRLLTGRDRFAERKPNKKRRAAKKGATTARSIVRP